MFPSGSSVFAPAMECRRRTAGSSSVISHNWPFAGMRSAVSESTGIPSGANGVGTSHRNTPVRASTAAVSLPVKITSPFRTPAKWVNSPRGICPTMAPVLRSKTTSSFASDGATNRRLPARTGNPACQPP